MVHHVHHVTLQPQRSQLHQQQRHHRKHRQDAAHRPAEHPTRVRHHQRLHELHIRQQLPASFLVILQQHHLRQVGQELPHIARQQVVSDQRIQMHRNEHRRHEAERQHHRHLRPAQLRDRDRPVHQQVFIGGRERRRQQEQPDGDERQRAQLRRLRAIVDRRDQLLDVFRRIELIAVFRWRGVGHADPASPGAFDRRLYRPPHPRQPHPNPRPFSRRPNRGQVPPRRHLSRTTR